MSQSKTTQAHVDLLGKTAKDRVTGFQGVVITVAFDLFGCVQAVIRPPADKDGKLNDAHYFDVNRLEIVDQKRVMPVPVFGATPATHSHGPSERPRGGVK